MPQLTAVVLDAHGVRFVAAAHSPRELEAQVVEYIRERCDYVLWPRVARMVRGLVAGDRNDAAIAAYFANVGQRWDCEWLELVDGDLSLRGSRVATVSTAGSRGDHSGRERRSDTDDDNAKHRLHAAADRESVAAG